MENSCLLARPLVWWIKPKDDDLMLATAACCGDHIPSQRMRILATDVGVRRIVTVPGMGAGTGWLCRL